MKAQKIGKEILIDFTDIVLPAGYISIARARILVESLKRSAVTIDSAIYSNGADIITAGLMEIDVKTGQFITV